MRISTALVVIVTLWLLLLQTADSAVINVPADEPTIQAGLDAAESGDTVLVADGTYRNAGNFNLTFDGKAITLSSVNGPYTCVIDCEGNGRGFLFEHGEIETSILHGFTVKNGFGNVGGGIACEFTSPTISNCIIIRNEAGNGAGIFLWGASPTITNCLIVDNSASYRGGGLDCGQLEDPSYPTVINCTIAGNLAEIYGGGLFVTVSDPILRHSIVWDNSPEQIYVLSGIPDITYSDVEGGFNGIGNIAAIPLFVEGSLGSYYLSSVAAGQSATSPCVDAGSRDADSECFHTLEGISCLGDYTTRTDGVFDDQLADMGYHYATISTPQLQLELLLFHVQPDCFEPGTPFRLIARTTNPGTSTAVDLYCVLDIYGAYYFYPTWTIDLQAQPLTIPTGTHDYELLSFDWPDGAGSAQNLYFYATLTKPSTFDLLSEVDYVIFCFTE